MARLRPLDGADGRPSASMAWIARGWLVVIASVYGVAALAPSTRGRAYVALSLVASALMVAAWGAARSALRSATHSATHSATGGAAANARLLVRTGVLARLLLFFVPAFTSNDAIRYVWDGAATLAGFDPYFHSPRGIASLVPGFSVPVDNAGYVTLYPPGALALFVVSASFGPVFGPWFWKALATAASIGTLLVGERALVLASRERHLAWLALSPLLALEAGVGAHVDAFAALGVALAMHAWLAHRPLRATAWLALGALVKLTPALALAPLFVVAERRVRVCMVGVALVVVGLGYRVAFRFGLRPFGSLGEFLTDWRFGSPVFAALESRLGAPLALRIGAAIAAALVLIACLAARRAARLAAGDDPRPVLGAVVLALVAPLVASPVVFPWYLVASAPVVALRPSFAWLGWATTLPLTYEVLDRFARGREFAADARVLGVIAVAVLFGLALDIHLARGARSV